MFACLFKGAKYKVIFVFRFLSCGQDGVWYIKQFSMVT